MACHVENVRVRCEQFDSIRVKTAIQDFINALQRIASRTLRLLPLRSPEPLCGFLVRIDKIKSRPTGIRINFRRTMTAGQVASIVCSEQARSKCPPKRVARSSAGLL